MYSIIINNNNNNNNNNNGNIQNTFLLHDSMPLLISTIHVPHL